jgi:DNA-binding CsgD family transcriptional regulator
VDDPARVGDVHSVVPAHIGRASYHTAMEEWDEAISVGRRALAIVDRTGYTAWAVHRLLPIIIEAHLFKLDVEGAREPLERLRRDAAALDHPLGLAWVATADAVSEYIAGDVTRSLGMLRTAAERLEAVPYIPDAARLRRQLAGRLWDTGDRDGAIRELRRIHEVFVRLGALREIEKTRTQFQQLSARPPMRSAGGGTDTLSERELEIIRLVAAHKSNKAIGKELGISPRTVGTHLSNIYGKLDVASRAELASRAGVILTLSEPAG